VIAVEHRRADIDASVKAPIRSACRQYDANCQ
jgi:hypothetical protein